MPALGEIWLADLDPVRGHEQGARRPVLVVSIDAFNRLPLGLAIVVPLTSKLKGFPFHVELKPPEAGTKVPSWVKCEDVRSISTERLIKRWGIVSPATLSKVQGHLRKLLGV